MLSCALAYSNIDRDLCTVRLSESMRTLFFLELYLLYSNQSF